MITTTSSFMGWSDWYKILRTDRRLWRGTSQELSKLVSEIVYMNLDVGMIFSVAYNRAYDNVSGKCASYWSFLRRSRTSGLQDVVYAFLPKSVEQAVEVCDPLSLNSNQTVY